MVFCGRDRDASLLFLVIRDFRRIALAIYDRLWQVPFLVAGGEGVWEGRGQSFGLSYRGSSSGPRWRGSWARGEGVGGGRGRYLRMFMTRAV